MATRKQGALAGGEDVGDRDKMLSAILESLARSRENESWGLMVEAAEDYQRTCYKFKHAALAEVECFSREEKDLFVKISGTLYHKYTSLQQLSSLEELSTGAHQKIDTKKIYSALESLQKGELTATEVESALADFLPASSGMTMEPAGRESDGDKVVDNPMHTFLHMPEDEFERALEKAMDRSAGTLLERRDILPGYSYLNITIEKIELKDPQNYTDPFITVSVKSLVGEDIEEPQDTPIMTDREMLAITSNITVKIQRPLEEIPGGSAIFFEFKHFKAKKNFISTKCFSFMEMDEIKPGRTYLEIYKKPTDFRRKKLSLLSAKALYLHLNLNIERP